MEGKQQMVISRKRGECVRIDEDLYVHVLRTGADVVLQLKGRYRGTFTLRKGQVQTIGPEIAVKALRVGIEPRLHFVVSDSVHIVRGELHAWPSLVEQYQAELRSRRQQREQGQTPGDEAISPPDAAGPA
jgi:hypothetical protein